MIMEDYNLLDYNQHQLMKRTQIPVIGSNLVFLTPTKKGLMSPILKCKTQLASISAHVPLHNNTLVHNPTQSTAANHQQFCCCHATLSEVCSSIIIINQICIIIKCASLQQGFLHHSVIIIVCREACIIILTSMHHCVCIFNIQYTSS